MSLFGKILAVLNVLAALAFCYFFVQDYAKRKHWAYAVYRHDLALKGLPVDDQERDAQGNLVIKQLNQATVNDVFGGLPNPVFTQTKEVEQVRKNLQDQIDGSTAVSIIHPLDAKERVELQTNVQKLAWAVRPLAIEANRRQALTRLMLGPKDDPLTDLDNYVEDVFVRAQIEGVFDSAFEVELKKLDEERKKLHEELGKLDEALAKLDEARDAAQFKALWDKKKEFLPALAKKRDAIDQRLTKLTPDERRKIVAKQLQTDLDRAFAEVAAKTETNEKRRTIAHLLFSMAELAIDQKTDASKERDLLGNEAYKRALAVVGLEMTVTEMEVEAQVMDRMAQAIVKAMSDDRTRFAQLHQALHVRILAASSEWEDSKLELQREQEKTRGMAELVDGRQKQVDELRARLAARQKATEALLDEQKKLELNLFRSLQEFRDATQKNFELEEELRKLEEGR